MAVMHKTRHTGFINDHLGWHASQLKQVDFLPIQLEHTGLRVGQAGKGQVILAPVRFKSPGIFRSHDKHLRLPFYEFLIVMAQLRHMLAAEGSGKSAIENQQDVRLSTEIG